MTVSTLKKQALALKPVQRLRLVQDIWDSLAEEQSSVPVPVWHRKILEQRNRDFEKNPQDSISMAELKQRRAKRRRVRRKA
jgi:putative addiction module component (TIGR02574 family)